MSQDYDYADGGDGQMFHDFYNNYEDGEAHCQCPQCKNEFSVDGDTSFAECPYCGITFEIEETNI